MGRDPSVFPLMVRCGFMEELKTAFE